MVALKMRGGGLGGKPQNVSKFRTFESLPYIVSAMIEQWFEMILLKFKFVPMKHLFDYIKSFFYLCFFCSYRFFCDILLMYC